MEYSRNCAIPYISRIDGGTLELVRGRGVEVESSGDLVQRFEAVWDAHALETHRDASQALYRIKDRAFELIAKRARDGEAMTEFAVQQQMAAWFEEEGLVSDSPPVVAAQENAGDPHYLPTARRTRQIRKDELVLLDLWGKKKDDPQAVFADITWVGFTGRDVPTEMAAAFEAIRQARDAAVGARAGIGPATAAICADGRSIGRRGRCSRAPGSGNGFCIVPAITSGATCTATACTWTITKVTTIGG